MKDNTKTEEKKDMKQKLNSHEYINFDGCEYYARQCSDATWEVFDANDSLIADGILALSDEPINDIFLAIVNYTEQ